MASVREYAILYVRGTRVGGTVVGGGNAVLGTGQHALDGPEHTATSDQTYLDASIDAHGLLPKLSGDVEDFLDGSGGWSKAGSMVPWHIEAGETFTVPLKKQALFAMTIVNEGTLVVDGYLLEVH